MPRAPAPRAARGAALPPVHGAQTVALCAACARVRAASRLERWRGWARARCEVGERGWGWSGWARRAEGVSTRTEQGFCLCEGLHTEQVAQRPPRRRPPRGCSRARLPRLVAGPLPFPRPEASSARGKGRSLPPAARGGGRQAGAAAARALSRPHTARHQNARARTQRKPPRARSRARPRGAVATRRDAARGSKRGRRDAPSAW